jgi:hypothetical protein
MQLIECDTPRRLRPKSEVEEHQHLAPLTAAAGAHELQDQVLQLQEQLRRQESKGAYVDLQKRVTDFIRVAVPRGSTVLIVSKGDDELVDLSGRRGWHFPRAINGLYAGCYPADSKEAVEHLRQLQSEGAEYLVIPSPSYWWLEFYRGLTRHLERKHRLAAFLEGVCIVFKLLDVAEEAEDGCSPAANGQVRH